MTVLGGATGTETVGLGGEGGTGAPRPAGLGARNFPSNSTVLMNGTNPSAAMRRAVASASGASEGFT